MTVKSKLLVLVLFLSYSFYGQKDSSLVWINSLDSTIVTDVRYATADNFTGQVLYSSSKVLLRAEAAKKIVEANARLLKEKGLRLKIYDGYRPLSVQKKMWVIMPDDRYVANPAKGSRHNRGCAVDLTIIDKDGNELPMGTAYDDFTEKAHFNYKGLSSEERANRDLLRSLMIESGFEPITSEWWHFDFKGWQGYSILDIPN
ncbi:MAG: M15 family metallopeptidase [Ignavibacteriales bacterium]|nr:M15 family metallopeptidase [Ignavibacteriales bacterium]MCF8438507.1 M15 family metallopeptidase [Ignavibacteriales bacterium]